VRESGWSIARTRRDRNAGCRLFVPFLALADIVGSYRLPGTA